MAVLVFYPILKFRIEFSCIYSFISNLDDSALNIVAMLVFFNISLVLTGCLPTCFSSARGVVWSRLKTILADLITL